MKINEWPVDERPREKLLARGPASLSDAELLAVFIGSGLRGQTAVMSAIELLQKTGGLRELLDLPSAALSELKGIGTARAALLIAALELGQRHLQSEMVRNDVLRNPLMAGRYFQQRLRSSKHEIFAVLFLDTRHRPLLFEEMFRGTIDGSEVHPREVVRRALQLNAAAIMVGHNHPSGSREPSMADRAVTHKLKAALELVNLRLVDHFIIGDGEPVSLAKMGWC